MFAVRSSNFARRGAGALSMVLAASLALMPPASAQNAPRKNIIRDAEIEQLLRD